MMVPFSLEQHKAHFLQVRDYQEPIGNTYRIHWVQPNSNMAEIPTYLKMAHTRKSQQTEGARETTWIKQRRGGSTLGGGVPRATIAKWRKRIKGSKHTKKHESQRNSQSKRCSDPWKEGRTTQTVYQGRTIATPDKTTKCTSTQEIEDRSTALMG